MISLHPHTIEGIGYVVAMALPVLGVLRYRRQANCVSKNQITGKAAIALISPFLMLVAMAPVLAAVFLGGRIFVGARLLRLFAVLGGSAFLSTGLDLLAAFRFPISQRNPIITIIGASASLLVGLGVFGFVCFLRSSPDGKGDSIKIAAPVRGAWTVMAGGRNPITNYHHHNPLSQTYAVDLMRAEGDSLGETVYAPIDGKVIEAVNDREQGSVHAEGNIVVIESGGKRVYLAHLIQNSVLVAAGETVKVGQPIAQCGATGSAVNAHLHIHAEESGHPVAMRFGPSRRFLIRGDILKE